jgi:hypothetical protein
MQLTFPSIHIGLVVGIGGEVPSAQADVQLGDVVISQPQSGFMVWWCRMTQEDLYQMDDLPPTGFLNAPPPPPERNIDATIETAT